MKIELDKFQFEIPDGWKIRLKSIFGCRNCLFVLAGIICLSGGILGARLGWFDTPGWVPIVGVVLVSIGLLETAAFAVFNAVKGGFKDGVPRMVTDFKNLSMIITGPTGQWMNITSDQLKPLERPMDSHELEQAFSRRYGSVLIEQGWFKTKTGDNTHWGIYRLANRPHKKYTIYLHPADQEPIEVIITARLAEREREDFENQYDVVVKSIRKCHEQ